MLFALFAIITGSNTTCATAIIHARILHAGNSPVKISYSANVLSEKMTSVNITASQDTFSLEIPIEKKFSSIEISVADNSSIPLIISPGDDLYLYANIQSMNLPVFFKGVGSEKNNFVEGRKKEMLAGFVKDFWKNSLYNDNPERFLNGITSSYLKEKEYLNNNCKGLASDFLHYWSVEIDYEYRNALLDYPFRHYANISNAKENLPKEYMSTIAKVPFVFNDSNLCSRQYRKYVERVWPYKLMGILGDQYSADVFTDTGSIVNKLIWHVMPNQSRTFFYAKYLYNLLPFLKSSQSAPLIARFSKYFPTDDFYINALNSYYEQDEKFDPGQPAYDFSFTTDKGEKMQLSQFKGKIVYLTFYGSGCPPCEANMPYLKKLVAELKNQPVIFLNICVDGDSTYWYKAIRKHNTGAIETMISGYEDPVAKAYNIYGIPHYFLLDRRGCFAFKNINRPVEMDKLIDKIQTIINHTL
ncbi:TlpA family protein disulfide reductase [Chitinophagaceae bacterium MMS25-I14]